jgi:hypothetical protein
MIPVQTLPTVPEEADLEQGLLVEASKDVGATPSCDRCLVLSYCVGVPMCFGLGALVIVLFWYVITR